MARRRIIISDGPNPTITEVKQVYNFKNPIHKILILEFVERCLIKGISTSNIKKMGSVQYGIGGKIIEDSIKLVGDKWAQEEAVRRPLNKQAAIERISEALVTAYSGKSPDFKLAIQYEKLLADLQGTRAPIEISVNAVVTTALINVMNELDDDLIMQIVEEQTTLRKSLPPKLNVINSIPEAKVNNLTRVEYMRLVQEAVVNNVFSLSKLNTLLNDPDKLRLVRDHILYRANMARSDPAEFFSFVLKEETTRKPIQVAQHQRVMIDFVMAHEASVLMIPAGHSKTFSIAGITTYMLGGDPTLRGAIISATQGQAEKPLSMVKDYIEKSPELKLVYPNLSQSPNPSDSWTQTEITVKRPPGIRDSSLIALGYHGAITGARLNFVNVDDIISPENVATKESRNQLYEWFDSAVLSRLDPKKSKIIVTNTSWHPDDLVNRLRKLGWPTLIMDIYGGIDIHNTDWDSPFIRPEFQSSERCRLAAYGNDVPLFPERFDNSTIVSLKKKHLPHRFNQLYCNKTGDEENTRCKLEWLEKCKQKGRGLSFESRRDNGNIRITGVDLAVGEDTASNDTSFFTIEILPSGERLIIDIDVGKFDGPTIVEKIEDIYKRYGSIICVENNACFVPGTNVLTYEGYKPIESIRIGDLVWTHKDRWRPVTEVITGVSKAITTARLKGNIPLKATPNHWFYLKQLQKNASGYTVPEGEPDWISAGFNNKEACGKVAFATWPDMEPVIEFAKTKKRQEKTLVIDNDFAFILGLYLAEGSSAVAQIKFTLSHKEQYIADFIKSVFNDRFPDTTVTFKETESTINVVVNSKQIADVFRKFGKSSYKSLPSTWNGLPQNLRLSIVRGWLLGDGCLRTRNKVNDYFSGQSISRNLIMFMRKALFDNGFNPAVQMNKPRVSMIEGRTVKSKPSYTLVMNSEDSYGFRQTMNLAIENQRWPTIRETMDRKNSNSFMKDEDGVWSRFISPLGGPFEKWNMSVFNLVVEEDESYTVEDTVVHNAQAYIRQFTLKKDQSIPVVPHTTGKNKVHPEHGIEGLFVEIYNTAWIIPNNLHGQVHPNAQRFIDSCFYYNPAKHTDDVLMSAWFAREKARKLGALIRLLNPG